MCEGNGVISGVIPLPIEFVDRQALIDQVVALSADGAEATVEQPGFIEVAALQGGREAALARVAHWAIADYATSRNHLEGAVSKLSAYLRAGVINPSELQQACLAKQSPEQAQTLLQQLSWRDYFHHIAQRHPDWLWQDVEAYKTGYHPDDYSDQLPSDILSAQTASAFINQLIRRLYTEGYLHNHARLYLASYVVHWRRVRWQKGAQWFLTHLLDGDIASNNLSWQWVASTFSAKPYFYNLENVTKFAGKASEYALVPEDNQPLDASYDELRSRLFPHGVF